MLHSHAIATLFPVIDTSMSKVSYTNPQNAPHYPKYADKQLLTKEATAFGFCRDGEDDAVVYDDEYASAITSEHETMEGTVAEVLRGSAIIAEPPVEVIVSHPHDSSREMLNLEVDEADSEDGLSFV